MHFPIGLSTSKTVKVKRKQGNVLGLTLCKCRGGRGYTVPAEEEGGGDTVPADNYLLQPCDCHFVFQFCPLSVTDQLVVQFPRAEDQPAHSVTVRTTILRYHTLERGA